MSLREKLLSDRFIVTSELGPPKGTSLHKTLEEIEPVASRLDAVNVTDLQSSVMRMSSLAASIILKDRGFEPILQMTCRDRNRLALQADALSAAAFGIDNIVVLTGDHPSLGDHPQAKPVFDVDAVQLLSVLRKLETGKDMNDHALSGEPPRYCLGAVVNPGADPLEPEIIKMEKKIEAGAEFFQTQAIYDVAVFEKFLKKTQSLKVPILAGIVFLKSEKMARYMNEHVPGVCVPDSIVNEMAQTHDKRAQSIEITSRLIRQLKPMVRGIHLMPIGWYAILPEVLDAMGAEAR